MASGLAEGVASGDAVSIISTSAVGVGDGAGTSFLPLPK